MYVPSSESCIIASSWRSYSTNFSSCKGSPTYTNDQQLSPRSWHYKRSHLIGIVWSSPLRESQCRSTHHPPSLMFLLKTKQGLMYALLHEQWRYSHLPQQKVGHPVEFFYLELGCRGRLASHRSYTNCWWSITNQTIEKHLVKDSAAEAKV